MSNALPDHGRPAEDILQDLKGFGAHDPNYKDLRLWSLVYWLDEPYADFLGQAYQAYASANGLNPSAFKSLKRFETQIIAATAELLHGGPEVCPPPQRVSAAASSRCCLPFGNPREVQLELIAKLGHRPFLAQRCLSDPP